MEECTEKVNGYARVWRLGTRGSDLALAQAGMVENALRAVFPGIGVERVVIRSTGDKRPDLRLAAFAGSVGEDGVRLDKGIFTRELEVALDAGEIDIAVHSLKDVPTEMADRYLLAGALPRAAVEDVLLTRVPLAGGVGALPVGAVVATSSVRRHCQLLELCPGVSVVEIRGNVPTRLRKLAYNEDIDGLLLARAGLERLGWSPAAGRILFEDVYLHAVILPAEEMLPAASQGVVAMEIRSGDEEALKLVAAISDCATWLQVRCERHFLHLLKAGCQTPVGILTTIAGEELSAIALVYGDGGGGFSPRRGRAAGLVSDPEAVAERLVQSLV